VKARPCRPLLDFARDLEFGLEAAQGGVDSRDAADPRDAADSRELTTCVICFEPCDPRRQQFPLEAMPCAHVFHVECLQAWRETTRITDRSRCPNGCHRVLGHPFFSRYSRDRDVPHVPPERNIGGVEAEAAAENQSEVREVNSPTSPGDVAFL